MCHICGQPIWKPCSCKPSSCCPPDPSGCVVKLDAKCILYHKDNNTITGLDNLELTNGATLELFMDTVDDYIGQIKANEWNLPILEADYTINTLQQFAVAVDTEIGYSRKWKGNVNADPVTTTDGDYWFRTDLPAADGLRMKLNGAVRTIPTT